MPKRPRWKTRIAVHESGSETRNKRWKNPLWDFELVIDGATSASQRVNLIANSQRTMQDFFQRCQGSGNAFLYEDLTDNWGIGQPLGESDGETTEFVFQRMAQSFAEPIGWLLNVTAVYIDGEKQIDGWNTESPNILRFSIPPDRGVVTADFNFAFLCRFSDDQMDQVQFMRDLWEMRAIKFQSLRSRRDS